MSDSLKDRRTRFTRSEIREAYLSLLEEHPPEKITVSAVCRAANIGRGTFYLHYQDIRAVEEDIEDVIFRESRNIVSAVFSGTMVGNEEKNYRHLAESQAWQKLYFDKPNGSLSRLLAQDAICRVMELLRDVDWPEKQKLLYAVYVVGGAIAVEHYRNKTGIEDFEQENTYYTQILDTIEIAFFKRRLIKKQ